jgi:sugar phosphate permease
MALAGQLVDRFGPSKVLGTALLLGAACTAALGPSMASVALAAITTALVGFFVGIARSGCIALAAIIYPTEIRATGIGWGMAMARGGQVVAPPRDASLKLLVMAAALVISIIFVFCSSELAGSTRCAPQRSGTRSHRDLKLRTAD